MSVQTARASRAVVALTALLAPALGCREPDRSARTLREGPASAPRPRPRPLRDAGTPDARRPDAGPTVPPYTGPRGSIEGVVYLDGPIRPGTPITVPTAFASRAGCGDAAMRYGQPFDISTPGVFPGALVAAEARDSSPLPPTPRTITFRACDLVPRVVFARVGDPIMMHAGTRTSELPHIEGSGAVIDQALIPGQPDLRRMVPNPGHYAVTSRGMPAFALTDLYMLPNRFIDTTDVAGHFRITDVPVGNVTVHAWYPGTTEAREVVNVRAGESARVEFHLRQQPPRPAPPPLQPPIGPDGRPMRIPG